MSRWRSWAAIYRETGNAMDGMIDDPEGFRPGAGVILEFGLLEEADGEIIRWDTGFETGDRVPSNYDSMIAKLIVYGRTREGCIMRLRRALEEMVVEGVKTNIPLHQELLRQDDVLNGDYSIKWLENWLEERAV